MRFPLVYVEGNLAAAADGSFWAGWEIEPHSYEFLSHQARLEQGEAYLRLLWSQVTEGLCVRLCHEASVEQYLGALAGRRPPGDEPLGVAFDRALARLRERMSDRPPLGRSDLLFLRLPAQAGSGWGELRGAARALRAGIEGAFGLAGPRVASEALDRARLEERRLARHLAGCFRARPLETGDWLGLVERLRRRGLVPEGPPAAAQRAVLEVVGEGVVLRPARAQLAGAFECELRESARQLELRGDDDERSFHTYLCLADFPAGRFPGPGSEWLYALDDFSFPVDAALRFRCLRAEETVRAARRKRSELEDQVRHTEQAEARPPAPLLEALEDATELVDETKRTGAPLVWMSAVLCAYAPDPEELRQRSEELRSAYATQLMRLARPRGEQLRLLLSFLPGGPEPPSDYAIPVSPAVIAAAQCFATHEVGHGRRDPTAPPLGHTLTAPSREPHPGPGRPALFDPGLAARSNESPAVCLLGSLGAGKSVAAAAIVHRALLEGARGLVLDPKGEWWALAQAPGLEGRVRVVRLDADSRACFDPLGLGLAAGEASARDVALGVADSFLCLLCGAAPDSEESLLIGAAVKAVSEAGGRLADVIEAVRSQRGDAAARLARRLDRYAAHPLARIAFAPEPGDGAKAGELVSGAGAQLTVLDLSGLPLPDRRAVSGGLSLEQHLGLALLYLVTSAAQAFVTRGDRRRLRLLVCEEAWAVLATAEGRAALRALVRLGRAMNVTALLVSQSAGDLARVEGLAEHCPQRLVFRQPDAREAEECLRFLGLEPSDDLRALVAGLGTGQSLVRDLDGRVGLVQHDPDPELLHAFDTRPEAMAAKLEARTAAP